MQAKASGTGGVPAWPFGPSAALNAEGSCISRPGQLARLTSFRLLTESLCQEQQVGAVFQTG